MRRLSLCTVTRTSGVRLLVLMGACGTTSVAAGGVPASRKWVGPEIPGPLGGQVRTTIYYGPWQCSQAWMNHCQSKCAAQGHRLMGCIWLADVKTDWQSRFLGYPMSAGGRLAITHCCCDYPIAKDTEAQRRKWEGVKKSFRKRWSKELGDWPVDGDEEYWPGHHIRDLGRGGDPIADGNVLPTPPDIHSVFTKEYPLCYAGAARWSNVGPDLPYMD
jgi:hypothetical protein